MNRALPLGWSWAVPDDVATRSPHALAIGPFGSNLKVSDYKSSGVPLVFVRHVRAERFDAGTHFVSEAKAKELTPHSVSGGDVLITKMGEPPGDSAIYPLHLPDAIITADCIKWSIDQRVGEPKFFMYAIRTSELRQQIIAITNGVAQKKVSLGRFRTITFPCAPRDEQARVVDAVDSYLSRLDKAIDSLESVQIKLKAYRASVLKAAVEGRLVPTEASLARAEKRDYEPAEVLLARIISERRRRWGEAELAKLNAAGKTPKEDKWKAKYQEPVGPDTRQLPKLPEGWCWASVDQLTDGARNSGYGVLVPGPDVADGVPLIRVGDIHDGTVTVSELKRIDRVIADQFSKTYLSGGEVLLSLVGTIGRSAVVPASLSGANVARAVGVIPMSSLVRSRWVEIWFRSPRIQSLMNSRAHEVARKTLNLEDVRAAAVAVPSVCEQDRIIAEAEDLESVVAATVSTVAANSIRSIRLRQSILRWAFEGKLADHDPSDEPADELLARIRAERVAAAPTKKTRSRAAKRAA